MGMVGRHQPRVQIVCLCEGEQREIPIGAGTVRLERANIKADEGWGTYFVPRQDGRYTIDLNIHGQDPAAKIDNVRLVAYGGGWK
jgi:hypothetical protein